MRDSPGLPDAPGAGVSRWRHPRAEGSRRQSRSRPSCHQGRRPPAFRSPESPARPGGPGGPWPRRGRSGSRPRGSRSGTGPPPRAAMGRPVGREGEVADLLHPRLDLAQFPPVSCIPDLEVILLAICHDVLTVRRIDDVVDVRKLAEADSAQAHRGPRRQGIAVAIGPRRLRWRSRGPGPGCGLRCVSGRSRSQQRRGGPGQSTERQHDQNRGSNACHEHHLQNLPHQAGDGRRHSGRRDRRLGRTIWDRLEGQPHEMGQVRSRARSFAEDGARSSGGQPHPRGGEAAAGEPAGQGPARPRRPGSLTVPNTASPTPARRLPRG